MARVLHGLSIDSLPNPGELEPSDQIVVYKEDTGAAYRSTVGGLGASAQADITDAFSVSENYKAGDYVIYNNILYRFTADKSAGEWDEGVVEATTVGEELNALGSLSGEIDTINSTLTSCLKEDGIEIPSGYRAVNYRYPIGRLGNFPILFFFGSSVGVMNVDGANTTSTLSSSHVSVSWLRGGSGITVQSILDTGHTDGVRVKLTFSSGVTNTTATGMIPLRFGYDCYSAAAATS